MGITSLQNTHIGFSPPKNMTAELSSPTFTPAATAAWIQAAVPQGLIKHHQHHHILYVYIYIYEYIYEYLYTHISMSMSIWRYPNETSPKQSPNAASATVPLRISATSLALRRGVSTTFANGFQHLPDVGESWLPSGKHTKNWWENHHF